MLGPYAGQRPRAAMAASGNTDGTRYRRVASMSGRTVCNHGVVAVEDETADTSPSESLDKGVDLFDISDYLPVYPKAEARCSLLDHAHAHGGHAVHRIPDHRNALGDSELVQQLDPLAADAVVIGY